MKRSTAIRHLGEVADECAGVNTTLTHLDSPLRLASFWVFGDVLDPAWPEDKQFANTAMAVTLPETTVWWYARPHGVEWIEQMSRWGKRPVHIMWRSADAPVWNHYIERPLLLWDEAGGVRHHALEALRQDGDVDHHREPAPTPEELRARLERESAVSLKAMSKAAAAYDEHRWGGGKLIKYAEPLWEATAGYLDVLEGMTAVD